MKQVININFQGRVVPIETSAFDLLKQYTDSLNKHFADEEGKDEIINDIESRIGELFQQRLNAGATCITDDDVNAVIKSMGRPEEFEGEEEKAATQLKSDNGSDNTQQQSQTHAHKRLYRDENNKVLGGVCAGIANYFAIDALLVRILFILSGIGLVAYVLLWAFVPSSSETTIGGVRKKFYRDSDDKIISGVCSGIGNYFGINPWIPRVLFLLPFLSFVFRWNHWGAVTFPDFIKFSFSPMAFIVYIILWIIVPEASTTSEKLEMKGTKVDIDSIKKSVVEEMKGVQQRAQKFGKEASAAVSDKAKIFSAEASNVARKGSKGLGDVIVFLLRIFAYIIIGIVALSLILVLFGLGIAAIGIFPLKDFVISGGWENFFAWGTLLFFIGVPILAIITWIVRKLARAKSNMKMLTLSFAAMWIVGWVCMIMLVASVSKDFYYNSKDVTEKEVFLTNPKVSKLELTAANPLERYTSRNWLRFEPFLGIDDDTAYIRNVKVRIVKATNDSFKVTMIRLASGASRTEAENLAAKIVFNGVQKDSILQFDKGIPVNKTDKFRNQEVVLTVYVPVGKHIKIDRTMSWFNDVHFGFHERDEWNGFDEDNEARHWNTNTEYVMGADGKLYTLDGRLAGEERRRREIDEDNDENVKDTYRYNRPVAPANKLDSMDKKLDNMKDSIDKEKDKINKQRENLRQANGEPEAINDFRGISPAFTIN